MTNVLGDDDLIAVMTPGMSASQIVSAGRQRSSRRACGETGTGGGRGRRWILSSNRQQIQYRMCYPGNQAVGRAMAIRSRERATLEALQDAVRYLSSIREERKATVAVTQGWVASIGKTPT